MKNSIIITNFTSAKITDFRTTTDRVFISLVIARKKITAMFSLKTNTLTAVIGSDYKEAKLNGYFAYIDIDDKVCISVSLIKSLSLTISNID